MRVEHKDATITPTGADNDFPGTFEVILSAPTLDRDGDTLGSDEWKTPLPEKITFDSDHGMSVATTVGSGVPSINEAGQLVVSGTYSSLPRAQEVRTLVNEGHINTTSVAFMTLPKTSKDAKPQRELLNGAFVAIPSNREALVLSSKSGARNSKTDAAAVQGIHDHAAMLGADCAGAKAYAQKDGMPADEDQADPVALVLGVDAALDEAIEAFASVDLSTLPAEIQQGIALVQAASVTIDEFLDVVGIPDPDENAEPAAEVEPAAAAEKSAAAVAETKAADEAESEAVTAAFVDLYADTLIP
ncbi:MULTISPECIES: hypothetical protein [unclassified Cryobacterium]|uniref:hypothetical protein n=1 Tax=unclassified Cryobacterium TaxID=2649013 RepID=UPI00106B7F68|nr:MULTISPECIES: hypothetical protein [unclassified Cryobacterium]TFB96531.1 hypothetical protein E3O39_10690 [Cryobacterium sp. MDB2-A-1]TFC12816.1 hypothetical protein E3O35_07855 [Cryobacterium sp. MDB2-A-2]